MEVNEKKILVLFDSDIHKCRRLARQYGRMLNFGEQDLAAVEIVASELSSNLIKHHARKGQFIFSLHVENDKKGLQLIAKDSGPGIADLNTALADGHSTAGTMGGGLPAIRRLMDEFSIESTPDGTTVKAIKWGSPDPQFFIELSLESKPAKGEYNSGDICYYQQDADQFFVSMTDVLGHGDEAHEIALKARHIITQNQVQPLDQIIDALHTGLKNSRGAAVSLLRILPKQKKLQHLGIGNVETMLPGIAPSFRPFCYNGIVGQKIKHHPVNEINYEHLNSLVMFTDGISSSITSVPDLLSGSASELCHRLFAKFWHKYDDATLLVGRIFNC